MKIHTIKTVNPYFTLARDEIKGFELRKNDRDYRVGDWIISREYSPELDKYSDRFLIGKIIYTLQDFVGLEKGYCILQIQYIESTFDMPIEVKEILNQLGYSIGD